MRKKIFLIFALFSGIASADYYQRWLCMPDTCKFPEAINTIPTQNSLDMAAAWVRANMYPTPLADGSTFSVCNILKCIDIIMINGRANANSRVYEPPPVNNWQKCPYINEKTCLTADAIAPPDLASNQGSYRYNYSGYWVTEKIIDNTTQRVVWEGSYFVLDSVTFVYVDPGPNPYIYVPARIGVVSPAD